MGLSFKIVENERKVDDTGVLQENDKEISGDGFMKREKMGEVQTNYISNNCMYFCLPAVCLLSMHLYCLSCAVCLVLSTHLSCPVCPPVLSCLSTCLVLSIHLSCPVYPPVLSCLSTCLVLSIHLSCPVYPPVLSCLPICKCAHMYMI